MVHETLGFQYRPNAGASMAVYAVHERKTTGSTLLYRGPAGDHFEPTLVAVRCITGANVPAIQSHGDRGLGRRDVVRGPFLGTRLGILLGLQISFASSGYPTGVSTNTIGIDLSVEWQHILEQLRRHPVGHEGGPLALQVESFRQRSVGECRGQRAKAFPCSGRADLLT